MTGGGSLIRMGCHPLSAVLYLKQVEARSRGETISVASVTCDVGNVTAVLKPEERAYIKANPVDVEDWGTLTVTFSDGTKATVLSADMPDPTPDNHVETTFAADGTGTLMTMRMTLPDAATRAAMLSTGMEHGMEASYVRLETTLKSSAALNH